MADEKSEHGFYSLQKPEVPAMGNYEAQRQLDYRMESKKYSKVSSPAAPNKKGASEARR
jgi:hypothetical protein